MVGAYGYIWQAMLQDSLLSGREVVKLHSAAWSAVFPKDIFCRYSPVPGSWRYTSQGVFAALWDGEHSIDHMRINLTEWGHEEPGPGGERSTTTEMSILFGRPS